MRNRQASGRTAEFPCQSAVDRQNSAADGVGQIGPKSLIYKGYPASRGRISTAEKRFLPAAGRIATGPAGRSEAPVRSALWDLAASHRRFYVDEDPARSEGGEELVPASLTEHPVRHGEDQPVELAKL